MPIDMDNALVKIREIDNSYLGFRQIVDILKSSGFQFAGTYVRSGNILLSRACYNFEKTLSRDTVLNSIEDNSSFVIKDKTARAIDLKYERYIIIPENFYCDELKSCLNTFSELPIISQLEGNFDLIKTGDYLAPDLINSALTSGFSYSSILLFNCSALVSEIQNKCSNLSPCSVEEDICAILNRISGKCGFAISGDKKILLLAYFSNNNVDSELIGRNISKTIQKLFSSFSIEHISLESFDCIKLEEEKSSQIINNFLEVI